MPNFGAFRLGYPLAPLVFFVVSRSLCHTFLVQLAVEALSHDPIPELGVERVLL